VPERRLEIAQSICEILKKLSHQLQPYHEVLRVIEEILEEISKMSKQQKFRVSRHLLSYADHQFGDRIVGKSYRERDNCEGIDNWRVEIIVYINLIPIYEEDESLSMMSRDNLAFFYYEKFLRF
jgi:hypothetical protein